jgi:hypothetical protein
LFPIFSTPVLDAEQLRFSKAMATAAVDKITFSCEFPANLLTYTPLTAKSERFDVR